MHGGPRVTHWPRKKWGGLSTCLSTAHLSKCGIFAETCRGNWRFRLSCIVLCVVMEEENMKTELESRYDAQYTQVASGKV